MRLLIPTLLSFLTIFSWARTPHISATDTSFCTGDTVILEVTSGYTSYSWNTGHSGRILHAHDGGWYVVEITDSNGSQYYDSIFLHEHTPRSLTYTLDPDTNVFCAGSRVTIQLDSGFAAYWWSDGNRYSHATYILFQDKRLVVEAQDSNGCEARLVLELDVVDCDTCNLIEQDTIVACAEAVNVKARYGFDHYRWSDSSDDRSRWIDSSGWYFVEGSRYGTWLCRDSVYIQLYPKPQLHVSTDPANRILCAGDTIAIEVGSGFDHYWWNTGHTGRYAELVLERNKTVVIEAVDSNGCEARVEFTVEVRPCGNCELFYHDSIVHCNKDSIQLEAPHGYAHYLWRDSTEGRLRWVHHSGWYHLMAKDSGQWCHDSIYVELHHGKRLHFWSAPDPLILCRGDSAVIELTPGFHLYHWNTGHTGDRAVLYPLHDTVIVVEALDSNGCESRVVIGIEVKRCTNGTDQLSALGFRIYPNPTSGSIHVQLPTGDWIGTPLTLWDLQGRLLQHHSLQGMQQELDLRALPKGTYLIQIGPYHQRIQRY